MSRVIKAHQLGREFECAVWQPVSLAKILPPDEPDSEPRGESRPAESGSDPGKANGERTLEADRRVLREEILKIARGEAERVLRSAMREAEKIRENAFKSGYEEGRREALMAGQREAENLLNEARSVLAQLLSARDAAFERWRNVLVDISLGVARKVIGREVSTRPEVVLDMLKRALAQTREGDELVIRLNPDDVRIAEESLDGLLTNGADPSRLKIVGDRNIERGGAIIESSHGTVDATIPTIMERVGSAVRKSLEDGEAD